MALQTVTISVQNFQKWQKQTDARRDWIALDRHFFDDPKVKAARRECPDSLFCYQWILMNLDYNSQEMTIRLDFLKREWMAVTDAASNRFDVMKRLQCLANVGLIVFQVVPNDVLMGSQCAPNSVLMDSQCDPKGGLEPAENGMALRATYTQHKQYKQDTPRARKSRSRIRTGGRRSGSVPGRLRQCEYLQFGLGAGVLPGTTARIPKNPTRRAAPEPLEGNLHGRKRFRQRLRLAEKGF